MSRILKSLGVLAAVTVIAPATAAAQQSAPTFTKDIAPIFQNKCEACHRPDSIAPMSLVSFEEARPWARSIKNRVATRQMPPWHIDKTIGIQDFENDRSLCDKEIDTIVKWVDAGAPKGDPKDMPPAKQWPSEQGWNLREAVRPDRTRPRSSSRCRGRRRPAPTTRGGSRWSKRTSPSRAGCAPLKSVRAASRAARSRITPSPACSSSETDRAGAESRPTSNGKPLPGTFMEWAVGKQGEMMRPNSGKLMLPGAKIVWDIHYSNGGEDITDHGRARRLLLSERPGAEVPPGAAPDGRHQRQRQRRQRARLGASTFRPTPSRRPSATSCCARTAASRASSRTCTCAARRWRWKRSCRTGRSRC